MESCYAERARALVGTRFRAQGRDPATGLDCAGLAIAAYGLDPEHYLRNYRLRGEHREKLEVVLAESFRRVAPSTRRSGDMLLLEVAKDQMHLAIKSEAGFVHADARLGRIVETPGEPRWKLKAIYRLRSRQSKAG